MAKLIYDKRGIPIERGDIVKVFHFTGARRKKNYMYKQCLGSRPIGPSGTPYMMFSHLNFVEDRLARDGPYLVALDASVLTDYEIVQSIDAVFEERPRITELGRRTLEAGGDDAS